MIDFDQKPYFVQSNVILNLIFKFYKKASSKQNKDKVLFFGFFYLDSLLLSCFSQHYVVIKGLSGIRHAFVRHLW